MSLYNIMVLVIGLGKEFGRDSTSLYMYIAQSVDFLPVSLDLESLR